MELRIPDHIRQQADGRFVKIDAVELFVDFC